MNKFVYCIVVVFLCLLTTSDASRRLRGSYSSIYGLKKTVGSMISGDGNAVNDSGGTAEDCDDDNDECSCFSGDSAILTESGDVKPISAIVVGDRVQTMNSNGQKVFADVVYLTHLFNSKTAPYLKLQTESGESIRMTSNHLLPSGACDSQEDLPFIRAGDVKTGDCVNTVSGLEVVSSISTVDGIGAYSFVTSETSGKIVVDNIVASSFVGYHQAANVFYTLHRTGYSIMQFMNIEPSGMLSSNVVVDSTSMLARNALSLAHQVW